MRRHADGAAVPKPVEAVRLLGRPRAYFRLLSERNKEQVSDSSKEDRTSRKVGVLRPTTPTLAAPDDVINVSLQHRVARRDAIQCRPAFERGVTF